MVESILMHDTMHRYTVISKLCSSLRLISGTT